MPWKTVDLMDTKLRFIHLAQSDNYTITELCHDFHISRKTAHKYLRRYEEHGAAGLNELRRRRLVFPLSERMNSSFTICLAMLRNGVGIGIDRIESRKRSILSGLVLVP